MIKWNSEIVMPRFQSPAFQILHTPMNPTEHYTQSDEHLGRPDFPLLSVGVGADKSLSKLTTDFWQGTF